MKSKTFVMMFLAIGCGLVAAYLTARISAKQATPDTQPVLVAKEKINAGQVIKDPEKVFVLMQYPTGSTPNAISNLEDLKNKIVNKSIQPGQWLTPDDLSGNFGIELPKGYYAMAIKVDAVSGGGGFILPKSRVNVVATIKPQGMNGRSKVVTILQDVLVLAVDNMYIRPDDKMAVAQLNTALLAVKPADSQKLTLAQSMGDLKLVLRSHDDDAKVPLNELEYMGPDTLAGEDSAIAPSTKPAEKPKVKLAIAKQDLEPGTVIDNPDAIFTVKAFAEAPEGAVSADDFKALKGKTIRHSLFKDGILTAKYFAGNEAPPVVAKAVENRSLLFIQNGGQAPQMFSYKDGVIDQPEKDESKDKKAGGPATVPATGETGNR